MLNIIDVEALGIPMLVLPEEFARPAGVGLPDPACSPCAAYRPEPQLNGNLQVDPDIHLPSPGMDLDVAFFYNAASTQNGPYGYGRTLSTNLTAQASGSPTVVTLTRGSGAVVSYLDNGSGTFLSQTPGNLNTLVKDTVDNLWKETTPDGKVTAYPLNTTGMITSITYAQDAVGNTHSFAYSGGLLQTLQDSVGRFVTFGYNTSLAAPRNLLTTQIGPTGCQTQYQHTTFAL